MKDKLYTFISLLLIFIIIFMIPTSTILGNVIKSITKINNIYFENLIKFVVYIVVAYFFVKYRYGLFNKEDIIQFIGKNAPLCLGIALIIGEIVITIILKFQDSMGYIEIKAETWLNYLSGMITTSLTAFGVLITLNQYISSKAAKEKPRILLNIAEETNVKKYEVDINKSYENAEDKLIRYVNVKISNIGENNIYEPRIEDINYNAHGLRNIEKRDWGYEILDEIDGKANNEDEKFEIVRLNLLYGPGMNPKRSFEFNLIYECNDKLYKNKVKITIYIHDEQKVELKVGDIQRIYFGGKKYGKG